MIGQVYKAHTDSYSVKCGEKLYRCKARGILKRRGEDIAVGDFVQLENGVITKTGTHDELLETSEGYRTLYETQFRRVIDYENSKKETKN